jgi:hypothetical protein
MSSILKVDQLQDSGGNEIITSNGSGTITVNNQTFKNGITEADQWRLTANITSNTDPISSNLERVDSPSQGTIGTGMTLSSGRFAFPSTGIWKVEFNSRGITSSGGDNVTIQIKATTNDSTYSDVALSNDGNDSVHGIAMYCSTLIDVTDISLVKVSFEVASVNSGTYIEGNTDINITFMTFTRLGDT